ncbi:MAG: radical SAM protein [Prolixibacteraceae bacterium]|nr:radical SAM protein [Prolixibacteraceae bacterium]
MEKVIKTKKGLFIRVHKGFGAIIFSPFSGLFFAVKENFIDDVINYCNGKNATLPNEIIDHLNIGCISEVEKHFEIKHYLPSSEGFLESNELPENPIVINWLISNKCNCNCSYCYAGDVIDKPFEFSDIKDTAIQILSHNPLAIVISGGEPLLEKQKLLDALEILGDKVGIIVDTNGLIWDNDLIRQFKKYKVVIRVSLDSLHGETNGRIRPIRDKKQNKTALNIIVKNIADYRKNKIPVLVHTVVTSINKNSLDDLFNKLPVLGVNGWRIFSVIKPNDKDKQDSFDEILKYRSKGTFSSLQTELRKKINHFTSSHSSKSNFSIQVIPTGENEKNSVVLVLPNGKFSTELLSANQKIDVNKDSIFKRVNLWGHYERYLGKI